MTVPSAHDLQNCTLLLDGKGNNLTPWGDMLKTKLENIAVTEGRCPMSSSAYQEIKNNLRELYLLNLVKYSDKR